MNKYHEQIENLFFEQIKSLSIKVHFPPVSDWWLNKVENELCNSHRSFLDFRSKF
ncbi:hypothetical protein GF327_05490 [Candidatus Woesearchaeota archaeon]|nr:hypothetical protein [Candidatus Woesearchaeota archaeon]